MVHNQNKFRSTCTLTSGELSLEGKRSPKEMCVMAVNAIQRVLGDRFRRIITGTTDGVPPWLNQIAQGDDAGLFLPSDAPWIVHRDLATLIGGIRALLIQALHPGSLAGVAQHSRYEEDALGRLAGTTKWLTILTFGSKDAIREESNRVNTMHSRVVGKYTESNGNERNYQASDADLLLWVHIAFTDSFLRTFELYSAVRHQPIADQYVKQWAKAVEPLGLNACPQSEQELVDAINDYFGAGRLRVDQRTKNVVRFIKKPPLSRTALVVYEVFFQAALSSIPEHFQKMLELKPWPKWIIRPLARTFLRGMQLAIGKYSPLEEAALERLERIGAIKTATNQLTTS